MALLTIDATIAVKFLVEEGGSKEARTFFPKLTDAGYIAKHSLIAPVLMMLEAHHALAKKIRRHEVHPYVLSRAYPHLKQFIKFNVVDQDLVEEARRISMTGKARSVGVMPIYPSEFSIFNIYDCVYVAHAMQTNSTLVTSDAELARIARDGFSVSVEFVDSKVVGNRLP